MPYLEATESSGTPERGGHSAGVHKEIGHLAHNALDLNIPKGSHTLTIGGVEVKVETSPEGTAFVNGSHIDREHGHVPGYPHITYEALRLMIGDPSHAPSNDMPYEIAV